MQNCKKHERYHIHNGIFSYEFNRVRLYNLRNPGRLTDRLDY
jgi:hypothetical protein